MTTASTRTEKGRWGFFALLTVVTGLTVIPIAASVFLALSPSSYNGNSAQISLNNFTYVFAQTEVLNWLANSLVITLLTVVVAVVVAAPAGYVISRARGRLVGAYSLALFVIQSLPVVVLATPLFMLFAGLGFVDNMIGVAVIYVGISLSVATWMMAAYFDSIPISLEEAAWMDGASVFGGFIRIVLRNSLPGILSTAIFTFLLSWNDYLIAVIFLRSSGNFTLPVGLQSFFAQYATDWGSVMAVAVVMMLPPIIIFTVLNRYFSIGGIGGSLAGR